MGDMTCLVFVNPEGIHGPDLDHIRSQIVNGLPSDGGINSDTVQMEETTLPYRDLLAMVRARPELQSGCFYILNKDSADKGAVLCVESMTYTNVKGMAFRHPSACTTRRFYLHSEFAGA